VDYWNGGRADLDGAQGLAEFLGGTHHQGAVRRRADCQHDCTSGTTLAGQRDGAIDRAALPRDYHLPGRIEIGRRYHLALRRLRTDVDDRRIIQPQDRGHRARTGRHRFLHQGAALGHQGHCRCKVDRLCANQGRVFAQTVSRHHLGHRSALGLPQPPDRHTRAQQRWLRALRLVELILRALLRELP
jgi:hypothetical protein